MPNYATRAGYAIGRVLAHLLPQKWREIVELWCAAPPRTPKGKVAVTSDQAVANLQKIEHIVVLMLENRSFDHMLGFLSLTRGRTDVCGLKGGESNTHEGKTHEIHHLTQTDFPSEVEDPCHSASCVEEQLANDNGGFVASFAKYAAAFVANHPDTQPPPVDLVMGYYDETDLPVYDMLAAQFCVCDRWFSSVPGATWPNRLYSIAGQAEMKAPPADPRDDRSPPIYALPSFVRFLDQAGVDWRWYSFDPGTLRLVDPAYRLAAHHHFAYVDQRTISAPEELVADVLHEKSSFLDDVAAGQLPPVAWIDPHFKDLKTLGPDSNDDHPPSDVLAGQDLVLSVYHALKSNPDVWQKTLLLITYDEHGGFYDHVPPPKAPDEHPLFRRYGVRVPALVVSPWVEPRSVSHTTFDHTSIIKTILLRFCLSDGRIPDMGIRTSQANHLGELLTRAAPNPDIASHQPQIDQMSAWRAQFIADSYATPLRPRVAPRALNDLQHGFYEASRRLRRAGLPAAHP
jgi:phospholipase C